MKAIRALFRNGCGTVKPSFSGPLVAFSFVVVSGCSYVPDVLNPVSWFSDDEEEVKTATVSKDETGYQKLSSVPDAPDRKAIAEGLAADPNTLYEDEVSPETAVSAPPAVTPPPPPAEGPVAAPIAPVQNGSLGGAVPPPPSAAPAPPVMSELDSMTEVVEMTEGTTAGEGDVNSLESFDASKSVVSVQIGTIYYNNGSAALSAADHRQLKKIASLSKEKNASLRIIGHSSSRTANMKPLKHQIVNFDVSVRRANNVADALIKYGIDPGSLYVGAVSDAEPVFFEVMPAGEAGNRRTEIYLDY